MRWVIAFLCWPISFVLSGQDEARSAIEDVLVETYRVTPSVTGLADTLITYRIYVDLAPGYVLQMVYGDRVHPLEFRTTSEFWNDTVNGARFGDRIPASQLSNGNLAIDSWLTIKSASTEHWGIPLELDPDGSILELATDENKRSRFASKKRSKNDLGSSPSDGLIPALGFREIVNFHFEPGYLGSSRGSVINTMDGAWGVLGGAQGVSDHNMILIAQLTTSGDLGFAINLQVKELPDGSPIRYVHSDPREGERLHPALSFPKAR